MRQLVDMEELSSLYAGLTADNRECILAVARALTFAQEIEENQEGDPGKHKGINSRKQKTHARIDKNGRGD